MEIKGSLGTIKAGKIITGEGPYLPQQQQAWTGRAHRWTGSEDKREGAKKMAAFAATIINLLFVLPLAQTLSQTLLLKGR